MPVKKLSIEEFIQRSAGHPVLDVRSPGEYDHGHIPHAISLPLFSDEERKIVGTTYKQKSREAAIKTGLDFFGPKMRSMVEETEEIISALTSKNNSKTVFVHCWRGGMRSNAVAWLLDLYGFQLFLLQGGYKAYRHWVLQQFEKDYQLRILGGYTGSGKTPVMYQLIQCGEKTIDLEGLAHHKGSAFGALGQPQQPRQEMFENLLAEQLFLQCNTSLTPVWIEDESQRLGILNIPASFWDTMRCKPVYFMDIPFEERLKYITKEYGIHEKEKLLNAVIRIQKRLGPLETKMAIGFLLEDKLKECFRILLGYYDKLYGKALLNRDSDASLIKISCTSVETNVNTQNILTCEKADILS